MNTSPVIVVVGSPNAGKSTLVNRLSGSRQAVVHETAGVTRDRKEIEVEWRGCLLRMIDTGGYDTAEEARVPQVRTPVCPDTVMRSRGYFAGSNTGVRDRKTLRNLPHHNNS